MPDRAARALQVDADALEPELAPATVFDRYAAAGELAYQQCTECAGSIFPPRVLCPHCGSGVLRWQASQGRGRVYSLSTIAPRGQEPYTVALIDLAEGYRMMSTVTGPGEVAIGDLVQVSFDTSGEQPLPVFTVETQK